MAFRGWMLQQRWQGRCLDKDLLSGEVYSPETCLFITSEVNNFAIVDYTDGKLPGVRKRANKYSSRIKFRGVEYALGQYHTPMEAYGAWLTAKLDLGTKLAQEQEDKDVANGIITFLGRLRPAT